MIRLALAMAFGFMSLGHGPIMTFAHAGKAEGAPAAAAHHHGAAASHHGHDATDADGHPAATEQTEVCNAFGCFITVGVIAIEPPPQALLPIGKLAPPPSPAALPAFTEPADPPPRLHG